MNLLYAVFAGIGLWYFFSRSTVTVESLSGVMKKVTVDKRSYLVTRLGGGLYNVTDVVSPGNSYTFNQDGPTAKLGNTAQLEQDMHSFPRDIFT